MYISGFVKEDFVSAFAIRLNKFSRLPAFSKSMVRLQTRKTQLSLGNKLCSLSRRFFFVEATGPSGMFVVANNTGRKLRAF